MNANSLVERDSDLSRFAGRILLTYVYEETLDWDVCGDGVGGLREAHARALRPAFERGVAIDRIDPRLLEYDLDRLAAALDPTADLDFDFLGIQTLYDRYLIVDKTGAKTRRIETPQLFWMRVAMGLFLGEPKEERTDRVIALYALYKSRRFCSSTPTLFNAARTTRSSRSCYLYKVDDSIESIMTRHRGERLPRSGPAASAARGPRCAAPAATSRAPTARARASSRSSSCTTTSSSPSTRAASARAPAARTSRPGTTTSRTSSSCARNTGDERRRTHDMNTANWIPDLFMKRIEARQEVDALPRQRGARPARALRPRVRAALRRVRGAHGRRGEMHGEAGPGARAVEADAQDALRDRPSVDHVQGPVQRPQPAGPRGVIHSSNLCTEITLNTSADETAVCNLGSVVLESTSRPTASSTTRSCARPSASPSARSTT